MGVALSEPLGIEQMGGAVGAAVGAALGGDDSHVALVAAQVVSGEGVTVYAAVLVITGGVAGQRVNESKGLQLSLTVDDEICS